MSGKKRRRDLSEDDRKVWEQVTRSATPLKPSPLGEPSRSDISDPIPKPLLKQEFVAPSPPLTSLRPVGPSLKSSVSITSFDDRPAQVGRPEAGLDKRTAERLRKGERAPDARLDLHGMTAERAHARLDQFIAQSAARGHRVVLVITGKGGRRDHPDDAPFLRSGEGVLRQMVPRWLRAGPYGREIVGIYSAHQRHGGAGALYVYLKKRR